MKRIGIYGGTFNPVHIAHLITAEEVCWQMKLDKMIFIPSANHPLKNGNDILDASERLRMVELAIEGNEKFEVSNIEIEQSNGAKSYTADTLMKLRELHSSQQVKFYLVIGMDNLAELHLWKDPEKLLMLSEVVVINRPGYYAKDLNNDYSRQVTYVPVSNLDISSTELRTRIRENKSIKYLVPPEVEKYILKNNLYKGNK